MTLSLLLWPWPWPDYLDISTWPRYSEDVPAYQKVSRSRFSKVTDRHWCDRTHHYVVFAGGNNFQIVLLSRQNSQYSLYVLLFQYTERNDLSIVWLDHKQTVLSSAWKWKSSLKVVVILAQCRYTITAQRIFKHNDMQYISLTLDKILNSLVYRTLFYVNIYVSYKLLKAVRFFGPPCTNTLLEQHVNCDALYLKFTRFLPPKTSLENWAFYVYALRARDIYGRLCRQ